MRRKPSVVVFFLISTLLFVSSLIKSEDYKKTPLERLKAQGENNANNNNIIEHNGYTIEVLGVEILTDNQFHNQSDYPEEFFYPLFDPDYTVRMLDTEAVLEFIPELEPLFSGHVNYGNSDYYNEIFQRNIDSIKEYFYVGHPETTYIFVKLSVSCGISDDQAKDNPNLLRFYFSNLTVAEIDHDLPEYHGITSQLVYFDKSPYLGRNDNEALHSFSCYTFEPGESLECTIGLMKEKQYKVSDYCIGFFNSELFQHDVSPELWDEMISLKEYYSN